MKEACCVSVPQFPGCPSWTGWVVETVKRQLFPLFQNVPAFILCSKHDIGARRRTCVHRYDSASFRTSGESQTGGQTCWRRQIDTETKRQTTTKNSFIKKKKKIQIATAKSQPENTNNAARGDNSQHTAVCCILFSSDVIHYFTI